jgi:hypothetical protein
VHIELNYDKIPMMKKTQKTFIKVLQGLLVFATLVSMIVIGIFLWNLVSNTPNDDEPVIVDPTVKQTFDFSINNYTLFEIEEFGFDFILADIHVDSNKPINLSLSHFSTNEGVQLSSVNTYLNTIESKGYNFGDYDLAFALNSQTVEMDVLLFIPIINKDIDSIELLINLYPISSLIFDLNSPTSFGKLTDLVKIQQDLEPEEVSEIIVEDVFTISKSHFYILDENNVRSDAFFSSNSKIVGVKLTVINKTSNPFRIQNAILSSSDSNQFAIVDLNYIVDGYDLIMNEYLSNTTTGYIFYEIFDQNYDINNVTEINILLSSIDVEKLYNIKINE